MTERIKYEYSVIIEADVNDDIQYQQLSEELECYFNTYENKVVLGDYQFRIHELPSESNKKLTEVMPLRDAQATKNKDLKYTQSSEDFTSLSNTEATEDCEDDYKFVEHTSECS